MSGRCDLREIGEGESLVFGKHPEVEGRVVLADRKKGTEVWVPLELLGELVKEMKSFLADSGGQGDARRG